MTKFNTNDEIGGYRIIRLLGEGGMGTVYEVEHVKLGVHYALKTFSLAGNDHVDILKSKFIAEGKVLARLRNPHIVRVFDLNFDEQTQTPYFVMDLVLYKDGVPHTLADVDTSDLEECYIRQWFVDIAAALDYIHAQGIVHRDIKLSNVLLDADKHVVLSDFGVLRFFSNSLGRQVSAVQTMISAATGSRLVMGTRGYMAPEVERGEEATPAADTYSLAVMIVYMLTGVWYEPGSKVLKLLETLELPWDQILPQMLSEDPKERPVNLSGLARKLGMTVPEAETVIRPSSPQPAAKSDTAGSVNPPHRISKKRLAVIAGAIAAIVAISAAAWFVFRSDAPPTKADFTDMFGPNGIFEVQR